jgi:hypothetical protein
MERFWSRRADYPVPHRHRTLPHVLSLAAFHGVPFTVWGLVALDPWPTAMGMVLIIGGKLWYIDRMSMDGQTRLWVGPIQPLQA